MASSSSEPGLKVEGGGGGSGSGGGEASEAVLANDQLLLYRGLKKAKKERGCTAKERISKMPPCAAGKRSSIYRGVTRHRWTGRYEAHLWDKTTWNQNQNKKGKQVYLGAYDEEEAAARAYDLAALKYWGPGTLINFPVSDYSRDLEEMQNVSREEYLASLRRKSSGFSRGISKYRALSRPSQSNLWEPSFGRMAGSEYFNSKQYGASEDVATESEYTGGFCMERKIDLTNYIKWWGPKKLRRTDAPTKSSEDAKQRGSEDVGSELKTLEWAIQPTEPYQMPQLGLSHESKKHKGSSVSALSILSRSAAYKSLQEKASKKKDQEENDENENNISTTIRTTTTTTATNNNDDNNNNKNKKIDYGKAVEKSASGDGSSDGVEVTLGMSGMPHPRTLYPLGPFLSAPLLTNYNAVDPLTDPIMWSSLVPVFPTGLPRSTEVRIGKQPLLESRVRLSTL
ncbi:AP2-like ethylene-responsive transcription factor At2g41710 isoform X1 [Macadamia integrifolia]|uniref:AP2-like ethylene-responsive transcription factor At2g41710 isoform X1 n=1 Tax=Macadamia integrifolia TaxID=60698 RepID=UPI001C52F59B|nr:AP2-like ethylene-responsive transcription factor At2g41710 isoform X1 [Macadamia integrifolia]